MPSHETETPDGQRVTLVLKIASIWQEFADDTSLHGCRKVNTRRYILLRLLWFSLIIAMFGIWVSIVTDLYHKYYSYPYVTKTKISHHNYLPFPAVSLCPLNPYDNSEFAAYTDFRLSMSIISRHFNATETIPSNILNLTGPSSLGGVFKPNDLVVEGIIKRRSINVSSDFQMSYSPQKICFTYNGHKTNIDEDLLVNTADVLSLVLNMRQEESFAFTDSAGIEVFIHDPREAPPLHGQSVLAEPGTLTTLMLSKTQYEFLPSPYNSFGGKTCYDETLTQGNVFYYSWVNCVHECIRKKIQKKCNCTFRRDTTNSSDACTLCESSRCAYPIIDKAYNKTLAGNASVCGCLPPCKFTQYNIRSSSAAYPTQTIINYLLRKGLINSTDDVRSNFLQLNVKYDTMIIHHVIHEPEVTFNTILSTLGGYMGFFLGASLLTMVELFQTVINTVWATIAWMKSTSQRNSRVEAFSR